MNENENLAALEAAENVEGAATEQNAEQSAREPERSAGGPEGSNQGSEQEAGESPEKVYTEAEFNRKLDEVLAKKVARSRARIQKDYEKKYRPLENVLKAGTGKEDMGEITEDFRQFYESKGVRIPKEPALSDREIQVLAKAEAEEIIQAGMEDVVEEVDRLAGIGAGNMTAREKQVFQTLAEYRRRAEQAKELSKLGVPEEVYGGKEFREFAAKFNPGTPVAEIYGIYSRMQPKKEVRTMGSMKNSAQQDTGVKDFYTRDEALRFTKKDFDRNPELFKAVERSMLKW